MGERTYKFEMKVKVPDDLHEEDLLDLLHEAIQQATGCLDLHDFKEVMALDEGNILDMLLKNNALLTCAECGNKLVEGVDATTGTRLIGRLLFEPGECNYPRGPDVPAQAFFVCNKCEIDKDRRLSPDQKRLLSSFIIGHWKELSESKHHEKFKEILETINPGAVRALGLV